MTSHLHVPGCACGQLIAPDPNQDVALTTSNIWYDFSSFTKTGRGGCIRQWAAGTDNLAGHQQAAVSGDPTWLLEKPFRMQRVTPEGHALIWSLAIPPRDQPSADGGVLPFLIVRPLACHSFSYPSTFSILPLMELAHTWLVLKDWEAVIPDGLHPGTTSPMGCELVGLRISHPDPSVIRKCLSRVGLTEVAVEQGGSPRLCLTMDTPKGRVTVGEVDFERTTAAKL